jgi:hypothetical protein
MKYSAIMPYVVSSMFKLRVSDIGDKPMDVTCDRSQSPLSRVNGNPRNIKDGYVLVSSSDEVID